MMEPEEKAGLIAEAMWILIIGWVALAAPIWIITMGYFLLLGGLILPFSGLWQLSLIFVIISFALLAFLMSGSGVDIKSEEVKE